MKRVLTTTLLSLLFVNANAEVGAVLVVQGLAGETTYAEQFSEQSATIEAATRQALPDVPVTTLSGRKANRQAVLNWFSEREALDSNRTSLVIYLIGHGSWDELEYKFNLPGPDLTATDMAQALAEIPGAHILINTSSASGAANSFLDTSRTTVVSATRHGREREATVFGRYFAEALTSEAADTNKDTNISVKEAFDFATAATEGHYRDANELATEHAVMLGDAATRATLARTASTRTTSFRTSETPEIRDARAARDEAAARVEALRQAERDIAADDYRNRLRSALLALALAEQTLEDLTSEVAQ